MYALAKIDHHRPPSRKEVHEQNAKAQTGTNQPDLRKRLHPVVVGKDIIQRIRAEPVLAREVRESSKTGSNKRLDLPLTKRRFPNCRAVGFLTRFKNAILREITRLINLPSCSQSYQKSQDHQGKHPPPTAPGSEQEAAGAENKKDSQRRTGSEQSPTTLGENARTEKHSRTVKEEQAWPEAHPSPDADGERESAGEVQKPGEMVGIVVKTPRPKGMALHPFRTKIRDPAEVWMRIWKQILKNTESGLRKRSEQQNREECEPFPRTGNDKNHHAINNPGRKNLTQNRTLQPQVVLARQWNHNPSRESCRKEDTYPSRNCKTLPRQLPSTQEGGKTKHGIRREGQKGIGSPAHKILGNQKRKTAEDGCEIIHRSHP